MAREAAHHQGLTGTRRVSKSLRNCTEECSPDPSLALFDDVFCCTGAFLFAWG